MASSKKPLDGIPKEHQQGSSNGNEQDYAIIAEKTAAAITAQEQPPPTNQQQPPPKPKPRPPKDYSRSRCLMMFPTSGRMGFEIIKTSDELPSVEIIREMIACETRIRLSKPIQELIDEYYTDEAVVTFIHDLIQQHVVERFGYHDVNALRTAFYRFPDELAVKEAFYVKHNKATQGLINQGQCIQNVNLFTPEGHPTTLFSQISAGQPLVLLAGSTS
jgi:hypothetical protein